MAAELFWTDEGWMTREEIYYNYGPEPTLYAGSYYDVTGLPVPPRFVPQTAPGGAPEPYDTWVDDPWGLGVSQAEAIEGGFHTGPGILALAEETGVGSEGLVVVGGRNQTTDLVLATLLLL